MNSENPALEATPPSVSQPEPLPVSNPFTSLVAPGNRRKGKVARKPKEIRDRINQMLQDGVPYADIITALGPEGKDLNEQNLTNWRTGGYQEWLHQRDVIDVQTARNEQCFDLACQQGSKIHQATVQVAAANLLNLLLNLDPCALRQTLEEEPDKYTRLLNALVRLSDGQLRCEQHQAKQAAAAKTPSSQGGISEAKLAQAKEALDLM